jgi:hypothetical protein
MPVIQRPTTNLRVELLNQFPGREVSTLVLNDLSDLGHEASHLFLREGLKKAVG